MLIGWFIVISWFPWLQIQKQFQTHFYLKALSCKFEIWKKKSLIIYMYVCLGSIFANIIIFDKPKNIQKIDRLVKNRHIADVTHSIKMGTVSPFVIQFTSNLVQTADIAWQLNFVVVPDKKLGIIFPLNRTSSKCIFRPCRAFQSLWSTLLLRYQLNIIGKRLLMTLCNI